MKENFIKTLVFATKTEAAPFIKGLNLQKINITPFFNIFQKKTYYAIISGTGKIRSALAVSIAALSLKTDIIINLGSCGALNKNLTENAVLNINKTINHATGYTFHLPVLKNHKTSTLLTVDKPAFSRADKEKLALYASLVDMEGAGFTEACNLYKLKGYIFKIISDTANKDHSQKDIIKKITIASNILYNYFQEKKILTANNFQIIT